MRFLAAIILFFLCGPSGFARVGEVRTLIGETVRGHVRITPGGVVVVNAERGLILTVESTNLARLSFPRSNLIAQDSGATEGLPEGWREADIGFARFPGSTRHEGDSITVRSAGMNIDGDRDSFHYVFKPVRGDSEIIAQVASIHYTHANAKAGLMMREDLSEYSRNVMLALTAMRGGAFQFRLAQRYNTEGIVLPRAFAPQWLKLRRRGNEFSAFISPNGHVWSLIEKVTLAMSENFYVGLALAGAQDGVLNWTTFSKVREAPRLVNQDFIPEVELISGSTVVGRPRSADRDEIIFSGTPKAVRVPTSRVARIVFQPLSGDLAWRTRVSRSGVFVSNGDFFDGDFRGIEGNQLTISSVLYGLRHFDVDDEALAVVLRPRKWQPARYEIEMTDGSVLLASEFSLGAGLLRLNEHVLGDLHLPAFEIAEFRRR